MRRVTRWGRHLLNDAPAATGKARPHHQKGLPVPTLVVLEGDQTGQELLLEALRVLDPSVTGIELTFERFDLSLSNRRATANRVVLDAAAAIKRRHLGLKAATITPEGQGDVGSPNRILREAIGGSVIVRTGRKLPRVRPVGGIHAPISVVRMAVGDAYGAKEWREGEGMDEVAFRTEKISRRVCRYVSEYAFVHASKMGATVFGGPKFTVSPVYEGMLKEEMDAAARRHPNIPYDPQLIDATYALLLSAAGDKPLVIPSLNRDGDCLSDLVMQLFGSIAGAESILLAFGKSLDPSAVMAEAPHGTAPRLEGKNVANPLAMILAGAAVLSYIDDPLAREASRAIYAAALDTVAAGIATADLGGHASTTEFTDAVILRLRSG
ncbi:MAG: isocitrate/isopropylmalate family dehydrogenase [Candidatus Cybelea sp.]